MTSKERLERVADYLEKSSTPDIADEIRKCLPDLEVLEILKKHYKSDGWSNGGVIEFWAMPEAQLKKVKECLEDGN